MRKLVLTNGYHSRDSIGSEYEMGDFLFGLVRMMKPGMVVETGCYFGDTSVKIAEALLLNGTGHLFTCDTDQDKVDHVNRMLYHFPATAVCSKGIELEQIKEADLLFSDSGNENEIYDRLQEFALLKEGALWVVHDANHEKLGNFVHWLGMVFPWGRGFAIVQK